MKFGLTTGRKQAVKQKHIRKLTVAAKRVPTQPKREGSMSASDGKTTVMLDDAMANLVAKVAYSTDRNKSEIIRACILLAIDTVAASPALINRLSVADREDYRKLIGK